MQIEHKGKVVSYSERRNVWTIGEFEGEDFPSLVAAKEYIDKKSKEVFARVEVLKAGCYGALGLGVLTSMGTGGRGWFTPKVKSSGYGNSRCLEDVGHLYPVNENRELVDAWIKLDEERKILRDKEKKLIELQGSLQLKMKSYRDLHQKEI